MRAARSLVAAVVLAALAACSTSDGSGPTVPGPSGSSPGSPSGATSGTGSASGSPTGSTPAAPPPATPTGDPTAPASRPGGLPGPQRTTAPPAGGLRGTVVYPDGVRVQVVSTKQGVITDTGPGSLTGAPVTTVALRVTNGGATELALTSVVVTAFYGDPLLQAPPVYGEGVEDFATTLAPGTSATARYAFSIPTASLDRVLLVVDLDGAHGTAVFRGSAR